MNRNTSSAKTLASESAYLAFGRLAERVEADLARGHEPDLEALATEYPDLADRIPELLPSLRALYELGNETATRRPAAVPGTSHVPEPHRDTIGEFRIVRQLGRGGMGVVYEAEQPSLDRRVALKVLPLVGLLDPRQLKRFKNEARAAAMLKHEHIVSVYSVGEEQGVHYYAMELVAGQSLAQVIEEIHGQSRSVGQSAEERTDSANEQHDHADTYVPDRSTQPIGQLSTQLSKNRQQFYRSIATLGIQAAEALHYAHQEGVVHRDIKPSNLLIDNAGKLWVADFGLARVQAGDDLTMTGDVVGTLRYMSPEQLEGRVVDGRSDVYSLGLTLFEAITGRPAFDAQLRQKLTDDILNYKLPRLSAIDPRIPRDLETIISKAVAGDANGRYSSSRELAEDLRRFLEHRAIVARRSTRAQHLYRWAKRNPVVAGLSTMLAVLLIGVAITGPIVAWQLSGALTRETLLSQSKTKLADSLQLQLYDSHMNNVQEALAHGDSVTAMNLLEPYISGEGDGNDLRGFEWYYLWREAQPLVLAPVQSNRGTSFFFGRNRVACSAQGDHVAFCTWGGAVAICDPVTMEVIAARQQAHKGAAKGVEFVEDGRLLVSGGRDGAIRLWTVPLLEPVGHRDVFSADVTSLACSPSGQMLAVTGFDSEDPRRFQVHVYRTTDDGFTKGLSTLKRILAADLPAPARYLSFSARRRVACSRLL